jgi:excinuclease ABC subunit C
MNNHGGIRYGGTWPFAPPEKEIPPALFEKVQSAPRSPGCYVFYDGYGEVIYVGKSKNLSKRVRQYFGKYMEKWEKRNRLTWQIRNVVYFLTDTELDALLLEYRLIKQFRPLFNAQLKRDITHPFLRVGVGSRYPTLGAVDARLDDDAVYLDCFYDTDDIHRALETLSAVWHTPTCGKNQWTAHDKPCLRFALHKCLGPCAALAEEQVYRQKIEQILCFLQGEAVEAAEELRIKMQASANRLAFEQAERFRQTLAELERLQKKAAGRVYDITRVKRGALFIKPYRALEYTVFFLAQGEVVGRRDHLDVCAADDSFFPADLPPLPDSDWLKKALVEIYADKHFFFLEK